MSAVERDDIYSLLYSLKNSVSLDIKVDCSHLVEVVKVNGNHIKKDKIHLLAVTSLNFSILQGIIIFFIHYNFTSASHTL